MRTVTHGKMEFGKSILFMTVSRATREVTTTFASSDGYQNAAHVHMTPAEARKYAHQLIVMAECLDSEA